MAKQSIFGAVKRGLLVLVLMLVALVVAELLMNRDYREMRDVDVPDTAAAKLTVITYNVGLLDIRLFGKSFLKPADFVEERFQALAGALRAQNADILALQEIYEPAMADALAAALRDLYPYSFHKSTSFLRLENGMMLLSKYPISAARLTPLDGGPSDEVRFATKSILSAMIELGGGAQLALVNVHPTSGGLNAAQDAPDILAAREKQIEQARQIAASYDTDRSLIVGDFNAGPEAAPSNYAYLPARGFVDSYLAYAEAQGLAPTTTWDARNILNMTGTHADSASQRIDHIFLSPALAAEVTIVAADVLFRDPVVKVADGQMVPLSDHYGLKADLVFTR